MPPRLTRALSHFLPAFTMQTPSASRPATPSHTPVERRHRNQAGGLAQGRVLRCEQTEMPLALSARQPGLLGQAAGMSDSS